MICVSVMLALFLGWPLAFGENRAPRLETARAEARTAVAVAAPAQPKVTPAVQADPVKPESCYKRYQRENRVCSGNGGAACRLKAADGWDLCEATGFWPE